MDKINPSIQKVGIVLRPSTPELKSTFLQVREELDNAGIEVVLESISGGMIELLGQDFASIAAQCDAFFSLGGDGTLISMLRRTFEYKLPCMGINTGRLGFLTAFMPQHLSAFIPCLKSGDYILQEHLLLQANVYDEAQNLLHTFIAINEFLISKHELSGMVRIGASIDGKHFNTYGCDGLIIGTPTGSTAYNISAGGSVIYPYCRNILLTPIAPHSLTQRPLVLNDEFVLEFQAQQRAKLIIDGQEMIDITPSHRVQIQALSQGAKLIYPRTRDYFSVLKEKFKWGDEF
ncbi:NAD(+)/NADH kinase [Helicobacter typhlonius]|uniref:NAD kinase n=1 Tax=Helicobacter typhlonius TaxID=76936 RepID=A0A099UE99_9HELI|nr:NAD(+)/NADH kinase [Helicobacter typhlonius]TLD78831.1 NAD(+)/NADH kinase [Helicobacter typhlonius]CUU40827.1 NAD kinase [Helicobacter typhlonius]HCD73680.1 NAD(+)/NADH kinase [Helicobacter sp.]